MVKHYLIVLGFLLSAFTPLQMVKAETVPNVCDYMPMDS